LKASEWYWDFIIQPWNYVPVTITRTSDPAYIPYISALDIVNGESKFDYTIVPDQSTYHDVLPPEIIDEIINELVFSNIFLQNKSISNDVKFG